MFMRIYSKQKSQLKFGKNIHRFYLLRVSKLTGDFLIRRDKNSTDWNISCEITQKLCRTQSRMRGWLRKCVFRALNLHLVSVKYVFNPKCVQDIIWALCFTTTWTVLHGVRAYCMWEQLIKHNRECRNIVTIHALSTPTCSNTTVNSLWWNPSCQ